MWNQLVTFFFLGFDIRFLFVHFISFNWNWHFVYRLTVIKLSDSFFFIKRLKNKKSEIANTIEIWFLFHSFICLFTSLAFIVKNVIEHGERHCGLVDRVFDCFFFLLYAQSFTTDDDYAWIQGNLILIISLAYTRVVPIAWFHSYNNKYSQIQNSMKYFRKLPQKSK